MRSDEVQIFDDVTTGDVRPFDDLKITKTSPRLVLTSDLHRQVQALVPQAAGLRRVDLKADWEGRQYSLASQRNGQELLALLSDYGLAWRDVARLVKVSVPAVQKWRRGEGITGGNRLRLAGVVALLECLEDKMINEPASWLEVPVLRDVAVTGMDMLAAGRHDLVLELAADDPVVGVERTQVLDEFDPDWRTTRVDNSFEVVEADDGILSIRPRQ